MKRGTRDRKPMPTERSKKLFTKTADQVHPKNAPPMVMRGGIRL